VDRLTIFSATIVGVVIVLKSSPRTETMSPASALSAVTIVELTHGIYRAKNDADREHREAFCEELYQAVAVHPLCRVRLSRYESNVHRIALTSEKAAKRRLTVEALLIEGSPPFSLPYCQV
jgi:hypothetical protein